MKITVEHTNRSSRSDCGLGRVWTGSTDQGTPLKVLIAGMQPDSDDPVMIDRFHREHATLPDPPPHCPECGEPMSEHQLDCDGHQGRPFITEIGQVRIDLYEVMARMLIGFGDSKLPMPEGDTPAKLAARLHERLELQDKEYHDALINAATQVTMYVAERLLEAQGAGLLGGEVAGHA